MYYNGNNDIAICLYLPVSLLSLQMLSFTFDWSEVHSLI
jgi:hypothetical protein